MVPKFVTAEDGIDPIEYVKEYFTHLTKKEISVLVGSIALLGTVKYDVIESVLELDQIEVEEKIGRLMQTDLLDGRFHQDHFQLFTFNHKIKKQHPNLTLDDRALIAYIKARYKVTIKELQDAFDLSYASAIFLLARFVSRGLITPERLDEDTFAFVVHYNYPKKGPAELSDLEKQLVGYLQMMGKTTLSQVALDLEEPEHKILSTLTILILSDMVTVTFEINSSVFGGMQLYIVVDKFQVFFEQRSVQILSNTERKYLGYLSLRRQASIEEIAEILEITTTQVLKVAATLHATNQFVIKKDDTILEVEEYRPLSINRSLEVLTQIHNFNYRILLGLLQTQRRISVRSIAQKMKIEPKEVIDGLISCYIEGLIDGYLNDRHVFELNAVRQATKSSDITLERWERIIMGSLISEQIVSWPKIAALLEVDRTTARNRAFQFISRRMSKTTAKDTVLLLEETPSLPPLIQIDQLSQLERQVFGYIKTSPQPSVKEISSRFDLSNIGVFRLIYFLCGSGLFLMDRRKDKLTVSNVVDFEPKLSVAELDLIFQQVIKSIELETVADVNLKKVASETEIHRKQLRLMLYEIVAMGYYSGTLDGWTFRRKSSLRQHFDAGICLYCTSPLETGTTVCSNCDKPLPDCGVCKGSLNSNEQLLACPHCKNLNHATHIKQWLEIKGECPFCRNQLQISQLLIQQPLL